MKITTSGERLQAMLAHDPFAVTREPFPAPVRTSRGFAQTTGEIPPDAVLGLAKFAREHDWAVRTQFAQGRYPHATTGRPGPLKDSIALRFGGHPATDRQAYAVYVRRAPGGTWAWGYTMIWGPDLPPYAGCGITEIKEFLIASVVMSGEVMRLWVEELKLTKGDAETLRKQGERERREIRSLAAAGESYEAIALVMGQRYTVEELIKIVETVSRKAERESMR